MSAALTKAMPLALSNRSDTRARLGCRDSRARHYGSFVGVASRFIPSHLASSRSSECQLNS